MIASSFQLDLLETDCREFLEDNLTIASCVNTFIVADKYKYEALGRRSVLQICKFFGVLLAAEIQKLEFRLMAEILSLPFIMTSEESTFDQLLVWFEHDKEIAPRTCLSYWD